VATSIGNALECYDIAVYGYFAVYISKVFFPNHDPMTSLLLTFGTFGPSFLVRPIGGVVLGAYADRHGRKASPAYYLTVVCVLSLHALTTIRRTSAAS
jgi:MHS family proline/betaine transporter-like MFS transporter